MNETVEPGGEPGNQRGCVVVDDPEMGPQDVRSHHILRITHVLDVIPGVGRVQLECVRPNAMGNSRFCNTVTDDLE